MTSKDTTPVKVSVITSLYKCERFLESFLECVSAMNNLEQCEFILVHNDPSEKELCILEKYKYGAVNLVHIGVDREGLYCSWNRAIKMARGKYLTIWNVDDIRFEDSICQQVKALDENPTAGIAYGDMYGSSVYGQAGEKLYNFPDWFSHKKEFYRSYLMSCFQMWRRSIHESVGYYDEQFRCVADFDFQVRTALHFPLVKVPKPLGIYLEDQPHKISGDSAQVLENNMVYLRYGVFEKIQLPLLRRSLANYKKKEFLFFGQWKKNPERSPFGYSYILKGIFLSLLKAPVYYGKMIVKNYAK
ncbi:MAG: glycosyltransferase [Chitinophagaceae bacterium]|nr:glycosyltransferase [Chitinophagaceae bacterium]